MKLIFHGPLGGQEHTRKRTHWNMEDGDTDAGGGVRGDGGLGGGLVMFMLRALLLLRSWVRSCPTDCDDDAGG